MFEAASGARNDPGLQNMLTNFFDRIILTHNIINIEHKKYGDSQANKNLSHTPTNVDQSDDSDGCSMICTNS